MINSIISLTEPALRYAVEQCESLPDFTVLVVVKCKDDVDKVFDALLNYVDMMKFKQLINRHGLAAEIHFKNKSHIHIVAASESVRGFRSNLLIQSDDVGNIVSNMVLRHCNTRPYHI